MTKLCSLASISFPLVLFLSFFLSFFFLLLLCFVYFSYGPTLTNMLSLQALSFFSSFCKLFFHLLLRPHGWRISSSFWFACGSGRNARKKVGITSQYSRTWHAGAGVAQDYHNNSFWIPLGTWDTGERWFCHTWHTRWNTHTPSLATVCSNVGPTVRAIVISVLARIDHVRDPEAWPTYKKA